jgi:hypothetical protein
MTSEFGVVTSVLASRRFFQTGKTLAGAEHLFRTVLHSERIAAAAPIGLRDIATGPDKRPPTEAALCVQMKKPVLNPAEYECPDCNGTASRR